MHRLNFPLPNSYFEALPPNVPVLEDRVFNVVIKAKWGNKARTNLIGLVSSHEETYQTSLSRNRYAQGKGHMRTQWEDGYLQA